MLAFALIVLAATATTTAAVVLRRRRARARILTTLEAGPAGLRHLASSVSDLSDLGLHLHAARRMGKPRLGAVLGRADAR
jgi:hypothetical protein